MNTAPKLTVMSDTRFMPAAATPAIEVLSAEKIYSNGTRALLPVNLTINQGEFITLLGPSGCGKSTLLKMVAGLVEPSDGKLMLWRRDSREKAQHPLSFVFQEATLMPWSSVRNNVRLPLDLAGVPRAEGNTRVNEVLELVGLGKFADVLPRELSGGMQMRVSIARGLVTRPKLLLMDEPFGAVDPINREVIQNQFLEMQRKLKKTVMLVSHDIDEALKLGDRIAVFRQGKIVQCASPDELLAKPANEFVGSFVGQDRTLKRLLLVSAGDVTDQQPTITVRGSTPLPEAFATMDDNDIRAITVVDEHGKPLGFVKRREARNASGTCADILHPFRMTGKAEDNLRVVLSRLYESNTSWMPIVDEDGRYNGEISQDYIAEYLSSGRTRRALNIHSEN